MKLRRVLTLTPVSWIALVIFFHSISNPIRPELADSLDPKDYDDYFILEVLLAVAVFVVIPSIIAGIGVQLVTFRFRDKKSLLSAALFVLSSAGFIWFLAGFIDVMMD